MNAEIFFIGLIALAAITVFEVTILAVRDQLAVRTCRVTNSKFTSFETIFVREPCPRTFISNL
jgi:hypothetical protein